MIDRLTVLCFAGTYGLALASELARFVVRSNARWYLTVTLTVLGWLVQTAYLGNITRLDRAIPVTSAFESLMVLSWIVALIGLYLMVRSPKPVAVGVFVLPLVLALVIAGVAAPRRADWSGWGGAVAFWGTVHGLFLLAGAVSTCLAFAAGLMYLVQSNRLKHKRPRRFGFALPSLEQSERLNRGAITVAFPLLTFGLLIGVVLSLAARRRIGGAHLPWTDPKVISALVMWVAFAVLLHARFRLAWRGRSVMLLTIVAFAFLVFTWVGVEALHLGTTHGTSRAGAAGRGS
ncbi:MAG: cytochrome c biogenesis protein CcsA [Planctomycetaceae bacterium]|nr:cytochrome c biogenesis protein CcsA [Planctomycetaceae bacterium]